MAVRAVEQVSSPSLADAGNLWQLVAQAGGDQDSTGTQVCAAGQPHVEAGLDADHGIVDQAAAIAGHLSPACRQELAWGHAIPGQEPVHVRRRRVAGRPGIDHDHHAPSPHQHQGRTQAGSAATDHHDVVFLHALSLIPPRSPMHAGVCLAASWWWRLG
jgi:hypothetical protein